MGEDTEESNGQPARAAQLVTLDDAIALIAEPPPETSVGKLSNALVVELADALSKPAVADRVCISIFSERVPVDSSFYERLYKLTGWVGVSNRGAEVIGHIWSASLRRLNAQDGESLLLLSTHCGHAFFRFLDAIPTLLAQLRLTPEFCIEFLFQLRVRIGNDMYQGGLWRGIESWCFAFPSDAFEGLSLLLKRELSDDAIAIGAAILGALRVAWEKAANQSAIEQAQALESDLDVRKRLVFFRSWINTGWLRGLNDREFGETLHRMTAGVAEEKAEAFNFVRCLVADGKTPPTSVGLAIDWLRANAKSGIPVNSQHWVVHIATQVGERFFGDGDRMNSLLASIAAVLPIPAENQGTWSELEGFLVSLLHKDRAEFKRWILSLLDASPGAVIAQFHERRRFERLSGEMVTNGAIHEFSAELFSPISHRRQFAFTLFEESPLDALPEGLRLSDEQIALCIFESRLHHLREESKWLFLTAILPIAEQGGEPLRELLREELLYEAKNYPGAVLKGLKTMTDPSPLVQQVVAEAEAYFDKLKKSYRSAINSMEIPGWRRAAQMQGRKHSKSIESHTNEFSILKHLCTTSYLIYGSQGFRYCRDGEMEEVAEMKTMSVSMAMPRLLMMDDEAAQIRRFGAIRMVESLSKTILANQQAADVS